MDSSKPQKEVVIVAGANGSGKTTFAKEFLDVTKYEFLNADEIAKELNPQDPVKVRITAGRELIKKIDESLKQEKSFVIESTLSGSFLEKYIRQLKANNYEMSLIFIYLGSEDLCIERIKSRVLQGGHNIPDEDVRRRFNRGLSKFENRYKSMVDYYSVCFNDALYNFQIVKSFDIQEIDKKTSFITRIGQIAMQKEKEKNHKLGIPAAFSKDGKIYYELADGTITEISPFES